MSPIEKYPVLGPWLLHTLLHSYFKPSSWRTCQRLRETKPWWWPLKCLLRRVLVSRASRLQKHSRELDSVGLWGSPTWWTLWSLSPYLRVQKRVSHALLCWLSLFLHSFMEDWQYKKKPLFSQIILRDHGAGWAKKMFLLESGLENARE